MALHTPPAPTHGLDWDQPSTHVYDQASLQPSISSYVPHAGLPTNLEIIIHCTVINFKTVHRLWARSLINKSGNKSTFRIDVLISPNVLVSFAAVYAIRLFHSMNIYLMIVHLLSVKDRSYKGREPCLCCKLSITKRCVDIKDWGVLLVTCSREGFNKRVMCESRVRSHERRNNADRLVTRVSGTENSYHVRAHSTKIFL